MTLVDSRSLPNPAFVSAFARHASLFEGLKKDIYESFGLKFPNYPAEIDAGVHALKSEKSIVDSEQLNIAFTKVQPIPIELRTNFGSENCDQGTNISSVHR
jgi:hypothetical protein